MHRVLIRHGCAAGAACLALFAVSNDAHAYIGPGAGFAFLGSTFVFVLTLAMAVVTVCFWPLQLLLRKIRGRGISKQARTRRVVIVGLDGLEPRLVERYMGEGRLPHMQKLATEGSFSRLATTLPALSPVAWSSFQTGVNPGAHNIFDFLTRDKRFCLPRLASTETITRDRRFSLFGRSWERTRAEVVITRKSQPFWKVLGKHGVFSNILRVPISYPPEKFYGNVLSAMCTPDLKGTQGSFTFYTAASAAGNEATGGERRCFEVVGQELRGTIEGPPSPDGKGALTVPFTLSVESGEARKGVLRVQGSVVSLVRDTFSDWVEIEFCHGRRRVAGICRFCLREVGGLPALYVSPVNVHPEKPALPIAEPSIFSSWLAKQQGLYGTLGLMEDTWGRNEHALDDGRFLEQTYLTHEERRTMFFDALQRTREGLCVCVFDASDRIQHMFWRYLDEKHPSPREDTEQFGDTIPEMYQKMDLLIGDVRAQLHPDDVLIVMSDHGFASFRRCVNLNTWLHREGYLALKDGKTLCGDYFADVDWSRTRAFAVGLTGIYLNRVGREVHGTVSPSEVPALKRELKEKLEMLVDPRDGVRAVRRVYDAAASYKGLYVDEAPDLIVGYEEGYRVSWDSITGTVDAEVFSDNLKAWSGDHHVDPELVPGVLFCNRKLRATSPHIVDIAPTVLDLFAVKRPSYMEGNVIV